MEKGESPWKLAVVNAAHKYAAYVSQKNALAFKQASSKCLISHGARLHSCP